MDYMLTNECESQEEIFDPKLTKYNSDFMLDNWSPDSMDLLDSIFDTDLLNLDEIDEISTQIKIESDQYGINTNTNNNNNNYNNVILNENAVNTSSLSNVSSYIAEPPISSNSSDSGLSSDNLEMDVSPEYEPLSPAISSPGPSISERGEKNSPPRNEIMSSPSSSYLEHLFTPDSNEFHEEKIIEKESPMQQQIQPSAKVIVQKIPQIINLPTKRILNQQSVEQNNSREREIKIVKLSPQSFNPSPNNKKVTIQVKNSNNGNGKIQAKSGTFLINNKGKVTEVKKLIPVQATTAAAAVATTTTTTTNPRSILLPVTVQDMKGLKTYKVLNMSTLRSYSNTNNKIPTTAFQTVKPVQNDPKIMRTKPKVEEQFSEPVSSDVESLIMEDIKIESDDYIEECDDDIEEITNTETDSPYPRLVLSIEEKRLLAKEGITLPSHYPLTKYEERELKRIRRKIRNKISAQDSRKRKKEYVDGLEERVKQCTEENQTLIKKIKLLQTQNQNLMSQMRKLQSLLSKGTNKTAHPTTCLLVLLLSLALVATPNLKFGQNVKENELNEMSMQDSVSDTGVLQNRRSLLYDTKDYTNQNDIFDEEINMNDFIGMNDITNEFPLNNNCKMNNDSNNEQPLCKKSKNFIDFDVDDLNWYQSREIQKMQQQQQNNIQKTIYDLAAEAYQKNKSQQTSGFNIARTHNNENDVLNKNILGQMMMINKRPNTGLYEINMEKFGNIDTVTGGQINSKIHISE